jgi:hypothetical protein
MTAGATEPLFVVHVREQRERALVGHDGREYESPPQQRDQALRLVALMLGRDVVVNGEGERCWREPVAGGQRSITLRRVGEPGR